MKGGIYVSKVNTLANQKSGVGKTTTAVNLGTGLAMPGKRVLPVDADAQGNLTDSLGYKVPDNLPNTLATNLHCDLQTAVVVKDRVKHDSVFNY